MRKSNLFLQASRFSFCQLEDRTVPATFTVTTVLDNGNDTTPLVGSLRAAIIQANNSPGLDTIIFNISGGGVQTISPTNQLPAITEAVTIDGTTQTGFQSSSGGPPVIRLSGANAGDTASGLRLVNHTGSTIRSITIGGFATTGILVQGGGSHKLFGNMVGVSQNGSAPNNNGVGIAIFDASSVQIGGAAIGERNIISGNATDGIQLRNANGTLVINNFIGTDINGLSGIANNGFGINIFGGTINSLIGGQASGTGNIISGNIGSGIRLSDAPTGGNTISGNRIGLNFSGTALSNNSDGIRVENGVGTAQTFAGPSAAATLIRSNTISLNGGNGVAIRSGSRFVRLDANSIVNNSLQGVSIDSSAQNGLLAPTLVDVTAKVGETNLNGSFVGQPNRLYNVAVFGNAKVDAQGAEGETQIGTVDVTTDNAGKGTITFVLPTPSFGAILSANVTDSTTGETSAFSNGVPRTASNSTSTFIVGTGSGNPLVSVFNAAGQATSSTSVFASTATGGVRVASADFNADGVPDLVVGTGPGTKALLRVIDGKTNAELFSINPFENFTGGLFVAVGDINGDSRPDVVVTPDQGGGPRVRIFNGNGFVQINDFFGIQDPNFRGGARAGVGDVNGDGTGDLIVSAGFGGGPRIAGYNGKSVSAGSPNPTPLFGDFFIFEERLRNGAFVAVGEINGDGRSDIIFGAGPGGGPRVTVLSGIDIAQNKRTVLADFFAGNDSNRGGVRVAARSLSDVTRTDIITGDGPGGTNTARVYVASTLLANPNAPTSALNITAFSDSTDGVYVG